MVDITDTRAQKVVSYTLLTFLCLVSTYFYYTKAIRMRRKLRNNSWTTTAFGLHTGVLNT